MADQQQRGPFGGVFEHFQQCVGGVEVHHTRIVDDHHPAAPIRGGHLKKPVERANVIHDDLLAQALGIGVHTARHRFQCAFAA